MGIPDEEPQEAEKPARERQPSLPKNSRVSFDKPEATKMTSLDRKDSYSGTTRVSFEKPADLYVTSVQPTADAEAAPKEETEVQPQVEVVEAAKPVDATNTGTGKGALKLIEMEMGRALQRIICMLHMVESPFK